MLGEYETLSQWYIGMRVSRFLFDFYCKQGRHWVPHAEALNRNGVPYCPGHLRRLRTRPFNKNRSKLWRVRV